MITLSTGQPSTLGSYKQLSTIFGQKAVDYIQQKINEAPHGEQEEVIVPEEQMMTLLAAVEAHDKQENAKLEEQMMILLTTVEAQGEQDTP